MKTIAIIAPSSRGEIDPANTSVLEARGISVVIHPQNALADNQSAGSAQERAHALMDVFRDPAIDAVMAARGGNRSMHILPHIDFDVIAANRKPFIGFSDSTALVNAFYAQCGLTGFHGPTLSRLARGTDEQIDQMLAWMAGQPTSVDMPESIIINGGQATGPMVGGNLSMFTALLGTPYMPPLDGAILFLEDIGDQLSRYDRMLAQLRLAGVFDRVAGIMFGVMHVEGDSSVTPFGFSVMDILSEHTQGLSIPVLGDAPFGHKGPLWTFPVGGRATLDADTRQLTIE